MNLQGKLRALAVDLAGSESDSPPVVEAMLEAANALDQWQTTYSDAVWAVATMRNDLNQLFPMESAEATLGLRGPTVSHDCEAIVEATKEKVDKLREENERLTMIINCPENDEFLKGVSIEAEFQRTKWSEDHDGHKTGWDWFWTVGYLAQKGAAAFEAKDFDKAKHHCVSTAALMKTMHGFVEQREAEDAGT